MAVHYEFDCRAVEFAANRSSPAGVSTGAGEQQRRPGPPTPGHDDLGRITGFAARRHDELLHFGTAVPTWGSGLASALHDALLATYPAQVDRLWLTVFEQNPRARRFWEKQGWRSTGRSSRTVYPPHPVLLEYARPLRSQPPTRAFTG